MGTLTHQLSPLPSRIHRGLMIERPHLTMTLWVLHPTAPMSLGLLESMPTCSPGLGSVSLYGTRTPLGVGGGGRISVSAQLGWERGESTQAAAQRRPRADWLRRRHCLAPIGCGAGGACALDPAALGGRHGSPVVVSLGRCRLGPTAADGRLCVGARKLEGGRFLGSGFRARPSSAFCGLGSQHPPASRLLSHQ